MTADRDETEGDGRPDHPAVQRADFHALFFLMALFGLALLLAWATVPWRG